MTFDSLHLSYLFEMLPRSMRPYLPAGDSFSMLPATLKRLHRTVVDLKPRNVLELGSGLSTYVVMDALLRQSSRAVLYTVEHDPRYFCQTFAHWIESDPEGPGAISRPARWLRAANVDAYAVQAGLGPDGWYQMMLPDLGFDLVVVDGPPAYVEPSGMARAQAFHLEHVMARGGVWFWDDYQRPAETAIVRNWIGSRPEYKVWEDFWWETPRSKHGIALVGRRLPTFCHVS